MGKLAVQIKKDKTGLFAHVDLTLAGRPVVQTTMDPGVKRTDPRIAKLKARYLHEKVPCDPS